MNANNTFLSGSAREPVRRAAAGNQPQQRDHRPLDSCCARTPHFGDITTTNNDGKSWYHSGQFGLQKRFSQGYTLGALLHLVEVDAGDRVPERRRPGADQDDLGSGRDATGCPSAPSSSSRSGRASGSCRTRAGSLQRPRRRLAAPGRLHVPDRRCPSRSGTASTTAPTPTNGTDITIDNPTTQKWFNTDVFTSILNSTSTNATPVNHLRTFPIAVQRRPQGLHQQRRPVAHQEHRGSRGGSELQLRAEFINAFNEPYFPAPVTGVTSATFGQVTASNQDNYARRAQLGIKFLF